MRRITKIAALAALSAAAVVGLASQAGATVNVTDGSGFVGKGDVQNALQLANDAAIQTVFQSPGGIKFTAGTVTLGNETRWTCSDGSTNSRTSLVTMAALVNATPNTNAQGKLSNGWNLNGTSGLGGKYISGKYVGAPYVGDCGGAGFTGFVNSTNPATAYPQFTTTFESGPLQVTGNGITADLPNTPIV
jgi:hypothetical protein